MIRTTLVEADAIEKLVAISNNYPDQVMLDLKVFETSKPVKMPIQFQRTADAERLAGLPEDEADDFAVRTGFLSVHEAK